MMRKNTFRSGQKRLVITKHFREKWTERYGYCVGEREIEVILSRSALAQRCERIQHVVKPSVYVDFTRKLCVLVDETPGHSVRVITFLNDQDMSGEPAGKNRSLFVPLSQMVEHVRA